MPSLAEVRKRVGLIEFRQPPNVSKTLDYEPISGYLFSGTGLNYARDQLRTKGVFVAANRDKVFFTPSIAGACAIAQGKSLQYGDIPIVIVIDAHDTSLNLRIDKTIRNDIVSDPLPVSKIIAVYDVTGIQITHFIVDAAEQYRVLTTQGTRINL